MKRTHAEGEIAVRCGVINALEVAHELALRDWRGQIPANINQLNNQLKMHRFTSSLGTCKPVAEGQSAQPQPRVSPSMNPPRASELQHLLFSVATLTINIKDNQTSIFV